jgi:hypothetical protein
MRSTRILAAAVCAVAAPLLVAPSASAHPVSAGAHHAPSGAGRTTVVLNPALVPVLVNTLKVHPIAPGRLSAPGGRAQVSFPITKIEGKVIVHSGGLRFTPVGGGSLRITAFDVDLGSGFLNAKAKLNGKSLPGRVNVFKLGPVQPINGKAPACAGTPAGLTLTPQAAAALGAAKFTGAFVGDACLVPSSRHR